MRRKWWVSICLIGLALSGCGGAGRVWTNADERLTVSVSASPTVPASVRLVTRMENRAAEPVLLPRTCPGSAVAQVAGVQWPAVPPCAGPGEPIRLLPGQRFREEQTIPTAWLIYGQPLVVIVPYYLEPDGPTQPRWVEVRLE